MAARRALRRALSRVKCACGDYWPRIAPHQSVGRAPAGRCRGFADAGGRRRGAAPVAVGSNLLPDHILALVFLIGKFAGALRAGALRAVMVAVKRLRNRHPVAINHGGAAVEGVITGGGGDGDPGCKVLLDPRGIAIAVVSTDHLCQFVATGRITLSPGAVEPIKPTTHNPHPAFAHQPHFR